MRKCGADQHPQTMMNFLGPILFGGGISLLILMLAALVLAALIWGGVLPEQNTSMILMICAGVCALIGGRFAVQKGRGQSIILGGFTAVFLCLIVLLIGGGMGGNTGMSGKLAGTFLMILAGGGLAGLMGRTRTQAKKH